MKIFLRKLIPFLILGCIMIGINYFVDPANLYNPDYESGMAKYLSEGFNVTDVVNYNERLLQKEVIEKMKILPSEIILGSSRIMELHNSYFNGTNFINNGVSGATFEDVLAIYALYEKRGATIKKMILDLDPWLLNDNHLQIRWKTLEKEYNDFTRKLYNQPEIVYQHSYFDRYTKYSQLVSFSYLKTSLDYIAKGINKKYRPSNQIVNDGFTRLVDGSIYYDKKYREVSVSEVEEKAEAAIARDPVYSLGNFNSLSENYQNIFEKFIGYLKNRSIDIEFYFPPFHPIVYDFFKERSKYHNVFETEKYFRNFAKENQIKVYGSYDPKVNNLGVTDFHDGLHCNERGILKILQQPSSN